MGGLVDPLDDECPMRLQDALAVSAHPGRRHRTRRPVALMPFHCRGNGNPEAGGSRPAAFSRLDRTNDAPAKIIG